EFQVAGFEEASDGFVLVAARDLWEFYRDTRLPIAGLHANNRFVDAKSTVDALLNLVPRRIYLPLERLYTIVLRRVRYQEDPHSTLQVKPLLHLKWMVHAEPIDIEPGGIWPVDIGSTCGQHQDAQEKCECSSLHRSCFSLFLEDVADPANGMD